MAGWSLPVWRIAYPTASGGWFMWMPCCPKTAKLKQPVKDSFVTCPWVVENPPPPHDVLMPAKTFSEPITLTNQAAAGKLTVTYILTVDKGSLPEQDDFYPFYRRARDRGWTTLIMEGDHNVQRSHPKELVTLIEHAP
jgi:hypothetical protein